MYITKFQVKNYKSFLASPELDLTLVFNVIVGQNNAEKTALAEVLSLEFEDKPHRSLRTIFFFNDTATTVIYTLSLFYALSFFLEEHPTHLHSHFYLPRRLPL